jgi:hypothetical protein
VAECQHLLPVSDDNLVEGRVNLIDTGHRPVPCPAGRGAPSGRDITGRSWAVSAEMGAGDYFLWAGAAACVRPRSGDGGGFSKDAQMEKALP